MKEGNAMELLKWSCYYFAFAFLVSIMVKAIGRACELLKVRIGGR